MTAARERVICDLRERIASLETSTAKKAGWLPFGVPEMDGVLPGGGLAHGALHEFAGGGSGTVDGAAAALFAAGIAARTKGPIVWCLTRPDLFFPALAQVGLHHDRIIFVESDKEEDVLANMEEGLSFGGLGAVVGELVRLPMVRLAPPAGGGRAHGRQWHWLCVVGGGRQRPMISGSRRRRPRGGG